MDSLTTLLNNNLDVTNLTSVQNTILTIEKYMNNLSSQVEDSIKEQYSELEGVMDETDAVHQKAKQYVSEFKILNGQIASDLEVEVVSTEDTQKALMNRMLKSESMVSLLHQLCQCHELLEEAAGLENIQEEASKLKKVDLKLKSMCNTALVPAVISDMQDRISDRLLEIFKHVSDWDGIVSVNHNVIQYTDNCTTVLETNIKVLETVAVSELTTISDHLAANIVKEIVTPIIGQSQKYVHKNNMISLEKSKLPPHSVLSQLSNLFSLLDSKIIPRHGRFRMRFWETLFEESIPKLKHRIKLNVPTDISDLNEFGKNYIPAAEEFMSSINQFNCSSIEDLVGYTTNYHTIFAEKYKEKCYTSARGILLSPEVTTSRVSDIMNLGRETKKDAVPRDPCSPLTLSFPRTNHLLRLPPDMEVSDKVIKLGKLVCGVLREATVKCLSSGASLSLCRTARNIAELFLIPSFDPFEATENPEKAARFYCDCWYLSHVVFWGSIELKKSLPHENIFDLTSYIRSKGSLTLQTNYEALCHKIETLMSQIGGLDGTNKENHGMVIEMAFVQIVALINQYSKSWKSNLHKDNYVGLTSSVIDRTVTLITKETISIPDISAKHSSCLSNNFSLMVEQLQKVRGDGIVGDSDPWLKFKLLISLLDDSLVKIVEDWESGFLSKYFKSSEVQHLAKALFQNTDKNAALRRRICGDIL